MNKKNSSQILKRIKLVIKLKKVNKKRKKKPLIQE